MSAKTALALEAANRVDIGNRIEFSAALRSVLTASGAEGVLFDCAFQIFFGNPAGLGRLSELQAWDCARSVTSSRRPARCVCCAPWTARPTWWRAPSAQRVVAGDGYSPNESLSTKDFAQMTPEEQLQARELLRRGVLCPKRLGRRFRRRANGPRIDLRATLRSGLSSGGELIQLRRKKRQVEPMSLVLLFDVSGSMTTYARMAVHFAHALCSARRCVEVFVFATRLTRVTRELRGKDADVATAAALAAAPDWEGGTRIAAALEQFNRLWSRRVLTRPGMVLLFSDAWSGPTSRSCAMKRPRLRRSCKRLVWLNPLLGYDDFQPKARGVRALLPAVPRTPLRAQCKQPAGPC